MPLPWDASPVSDFITEKSEVNDAASTSGTVADVLDGVVVEPLELELEELEPQAAVTAARASADSPTTASFRPGEKPMFSSSLGSQP